MTTYTLTCSGPHDAPVALGTIELPDKHPAPDQAAWGYLCADHRAQWLDAIAADVAAAGKAGRAPMHPQQLAPLGPPRHPEPHAREMSRGENR